MVFITGSEAATGSSGERSEILLNILPCTGEPVHTKNHPTQTSIAPRQRRPIPRLSLSQVPSVVGKQVRPQELKSLKTPFLLNPRFPGEVVSSGPVLKSGKRNLQAWSGSSTAPPIRSMGRCQEKPELCNPLVQPSPLFQDLPYWPFWNLKKKGYHLSFTMCLGSGGSSERAYWVSPTSTAARKKKAHQNQDEETLPLHD